MKFSGRSKILAAEIFAENLMVNIYDFKLISLIVFSRDLRDDHYIKEKMTSKEAKDLQEMYNKMEKDYKHLFNGKLSLKFINLKAFNICFNISLAAV